VYLETLIKLHHNLIKIIKEVKVIFLIKLNRRLKSISTFHNKINYTNKAKGTLFVLRTQTYHWSKI
jgi:hypothetical protein